jgi:hypothetical protein
VPFLQIRIEGFNACDYAEELARWLVNRQSDLRSSPVECEEARGTITFDSIPEDLLSRAVAEAEAWALEKNMRYMRSRGTRVSVSSYGRESEPELLAILTMRR